MRRHAKAIAIAVGVLLLAVFGVRAWTARKAKPTTGPATEAVERKTIEVATEASGALEPIRLVEVKSKASGEILKVLAETGQRVEAGALLAEIDPRDVDNAYLQAVADLEAARVKASTAGAQRQRLQTLREAGVITQQEYEVAVETAAGAKSELVRAQTNLELAKDRKKDATIRAPIAGTILERTVEVGTIIASATANVSGGTTLFKMADLSEMQVRAKVDETDVGTVRAGQVAKVSVESFPNRTFTGEVFKVEPQSVVEQNVTMFPVLIRLGNEEGLLRPGMSAEVTVEVARRDDVLAVPVGAVVAFKDARSAARTLGVPNEALAKVLRPPGERPRRAAEGSGPSADARPGILFVQNGQGTIEPRRVTFGLSDLDSTEVVSGVSEGERVVLVSVAQLQKNQQQMTDQMRQRTGGAIPGAGGGGRPPRGG